ncbi:Cell division GTPase [[Flavobacterium] thermophilum]|nr:Cell division GTPase [[Flavobacterium] thermophilum]
MFISFLGLGQAGGNIADEAAKQGFYSASINYSERDLESLEYVNLKLKLIGSEGIGKARSEAIRLMANNWDLATTFVKENFSHSSIEIIFVPFSTAGGSGSGIAPVLLEILCQEMPDKVFVSMPIIPDSTEAYISQKNCLECFEDLSQLDICTLPIDNEKFRANSLQFGKNVFYKTVNQKVIQIIQQLEQYTEQSSKYGVFDKKDLKALFQTKGLGTIAQCNLNDLKHQTEISESDIANLIKESWHQSCFADIEYNQIISAGIIFDGEEEFMSILNHQKIFSPFNNKMPLHLFEGYYTSESNIITTVLTGLDWCHSRLKTIEEKTKEATKAMEHIKTRTIYKSNAVDILSKIKNEQPKKEKVKDISSLINKFKR